MSKINLHFYNLQFFFFMKPLSYLTLCTKDNIQAAMINIDL